MGAGRGHQQHVAVRRRARDQIGADHAVGPGAVLDHHGLPERFAELDAHQPRHQIECRPGGNGTTMVIACRPGLRVRGRATASAARSRW